jgi:diguanylate cyclase (GGDEF)-like protein
MSGSALYPLLSTGLIQILIFINYIRRTNTDIFQRKVYLSALGFIFAAVITNFVCSLLEGRPLHDLLTAGYTFFFLFQQCSYYLVVVFVDYILNKNSERTKKFVYAVLGIMALNIIIMIANVFFGFYFSISQDNHFIYSRFFLIRFYMNYSAVLIAVVDIFLSVKHLHSDHVYLIALFSVLSGAGAALDIVISGGNLIWAFLTTALLGAYFYIIHSDTTLDAITGVGNRSSFTEFVYQASRLGTKQSYFMIQFDINGLKKINDVHGTTEGDKALSDLAAILKQYSRQSDFVARIGGDEFLVAIRTKYDVKRLISRILRAVDEYNQQGERPYTLSVSYGYNTFITNTEQSTEEFLQTLNNLVFQYKKERHSEDAALRRGL